MTALVFLVFAIVLGIFALAFIGLGMSNERSYWSQRDPSGDPRSEATPLGAIMRNAGHFATGEYRAPLRVVAIGVLMGWIALAALVIAVIAFVLVR